MGASYTLNLEGVMVTAFNDALDYDETAMLLETLYKKWELEPSFQIINGASFRVYEAK